MAKAKDESVHIVIGFFFIINYCIGTGFLSFPYVFVYSGYLAAIPTMILAAFATWLGSNYILETLARAQALEYWRNSRDKESDSSGNDSSKCDTRSTLMAELTTCRPRFKITQRKFEIMDLFEIFFHKYLKYAYLIMQSAYLFIGTWTYVTVAGVAWATSFPFHYISNDLECSDEAFLHRLLPSGGCLYAYYLSIVAFAFIVVTLSLLDLKEQAFFQLLFGLLRFLTIATIVVYCFTRLVQGQDACQDYEHSANFTVTNIHMNSMILKFDVKGWLQSIPIVCFGFMFLSGIPSFVHSIKQKEYLKSMLVVVIIVIFASYMLLGLLLSLWFRATTQENCTLNWATFTQYHHSLLLRFLSYYIVVFPSLDVISAYPLCVHIIVNSIYIVITGQDTSQKPKSTYNRLVSLSLRLGVALLPIAAAFGMSNLVYILTVSGFITLAIYISPFILQVRSIQVCKKQFADYTSDGANDKIKTGISCCKNVLFGSSEAYMTPYSYPILSHPIIGSILVAIGMTLFVFLVIHFFVIPVKLACAISE